MAWTEESKAKASAAKRAYWADVRAGKIERAPKKSKREAKAATPTETATAEQAPKQRAKRTQRVSTKSKNGNGRGVHSDIGTTHANIAALHQQYENARTAYIGALKQEFQSVTGATI